ncbi:MAG: outer membrane beta-barrel protein [Acidovorax sp.]|jgi:opacity protein-like surface antigen|nr:outer membrane beta-barrel protein [Acidovorax sp.]
MKRLLLLAGLAAFFQSASAQGYAGAIVALSNVGMDCLVPAVSCDRQARGGRIYVGTQLSEASRINLGVGAIDGIEVGYMKFGRARSAGTATSFIIADPADPGADPVPVAVPATATAQADALTVAVAAHFPVTDAFGLAARIGAAYVSSTVKWTKEGRSTGSRTSNEIRPYLGLGLEYNIPDLIKLVGTYDWTQYSVDGQKGSATLLGLGVEKAF